MCCVYLLAVLFAHSLRVFAIPCMESDDPNGSTAFIGISVCRNKGISVETEKHEVESDASDEHTESGGVSGM